MRRLLIAAFISLAGVAPAHAWGSKGHKVVALIAERHLSPKTRATVEALLAVEGKASMWEVASWADAVRSLKIPKQPSHGLTLQLDEGDYQSEKHCKKSNCVIFAIDGDIRVLSNPKAPPEAKLMALKYLIHFIGDLHQPLHTTEEAGLKTKVIFLGERTTLHGMWDTTIYNQQKGSPRQLSHMVEETASPYYSPGATPVDFALEGRDIARDIILTGELSPGSKGPVELPPTYADDNWPIVRDRLYMAGRRLAEVLNHTLDPTD